MNLVRLYADLGKLCIKQTIAKDEWFEYRRKNPGLTYDDEARRLWDAAIDIRDQVEKVMLEIADYDPKLEAEFPDLDVAVGLLEGLDDTLDSYNDGARIEPYDLYSHLKDLVAEVLNEIERIPEKKT